MRLPQPHRRAALIRFRRHLPIRDQYIFIIKDHLELDFLFLVKFISEYGKEGCQVWPFPVISSVKLFA